MVDLSYFSLKDVGLHGPGSDRPFYFIDNKSDTLLVTVGDSWTWGAELENRLDECYGSLVATELTYDLLNLGQQGSNNFWIAEKCIELGNIIPLLHYKKIIVVCMFTEVGRGFNTNYDSEFNFVEWFSNNEDFNQLLATANSAAVNNILELEKFDNVRLIFGTNMVDPIGMQRASIIIPPWFRIIADKFNIPQPPKTYLMHGIAVNAIRTTIDMVPDNKKSAFMSWLIDLIPDTELFNDLFNRRDLFKDYHPLSVGHTIIAEKIIEEIKSW